MGSEAQKILFVPLIQISVTLWADIFEVHIY
jgi:hypothetical protein